MLRNADLKGFFLFAAGTLTVQEAGGKVTDFKGGDDFVFGRELIAGCGMFSELEGLIQKNWIVL